MDADGNIVVQQAKKKKKIERDSSWSKLPTDMVCSIMNHLYYIDQINFRAVCKDWREVKIQGIVKPADPLPWMMGIVSNIVYLSDPFYRRKFTIETNPELFSRTAILASKYGWILFAQQDADCWYTNILFFYTPFTNQIIPLPELLIKPKNDQATFTASPLSKDCQIFVVRIAYKKIFISMCRPGDPTWTELSFCDIQGYENILPRSCRLHVDGDVWCLAIAYVQEVVYCALGSVLIVAFDVVQNHWNLIPYPPGVSVDVGQLVESDGKLFIVQIDYFSSETGYFSTYTVFRLDDEDGTKWVWFEMESLKNQALFISTLASSSSLLVPVEEESGLMNTIHSYAWPQQIHVRDYSGDPQYPQISPIYDFDDLNAEWVRTLWIQPPP